MGKGLKLVDLKAEFLCHPQVDEEASMYRVSHQRTDSMEDAHGVIFLCPKCFAKNNGPVNTHSVICWGPTVSQEFDPKPGRWEMHGTGLHDLTLKGAHGKSDSVLLTTKMGCRAHFHVRNGSIT